MEIPFFSLEDVPECFCSRYARLSSKFIFNKTFPVSDAWHMGFKPSVFVRKLDNNLFEALSQRELIFPGTIIGIYIPQRVHNRDDRKYTHLSLYLGKKKNKPIFLEQFCR